jgi:XapX domain-containing protein
MCRRLREPPAAIRKARRFMKVYVLSLSAGILVGVIYSLLNVRSPAPPLVALVGLLGILVASKLSRSASSSLPAEG